MPPTLSIVVPVYQSEKILPVLAERLSVVLPTLANRFEVILVNDGSQDQSWQVICELATQFAWLRGIDLMRNYGQHNALLCGIRAAQNEIIVTMDDDLQNPPEEIQKLLARLEEGYDVVYGMPAKEQHGLWRVLASQVTKLVMQSALGTHTATMVSAFRAFRQPVREAFANYQGSYVSIDVLLTWGTRRFSALPARHDMRYAGKSNYTFRKLVAHTMNMVTGFSRLPLQIASLIGFLLTLFGLGILLFVLGRYLVEGGSVAGFPFLASIIAIFSGAQLFALGIMGEYIARIHARILDQPPYTVRVQKQNQP